MTWLRVFDGLCDHYIVSDAGTYLTGRPARLEGFHEGFHERKTSDCDARIHDERSKDNFFDCIGGWIPLFGVVCWVPLIHIFQFQRNGNGQSGHREWDLTKIVWRLTATWARKPQPGYSVSLDVAFANPIWWHIGSAWWRHSSQDWRSRGNSRRLTDWSTIRLDSTFQGGRIYLIKAFVA